MVSIYQVINDNCIKWLNKTENLNKFDLIFCDPPYNIKIKYSGDSTNDNMSKVAYLDWAEEWVFRCLCSLKPTGSFWMLTPEEWLGSYLSICSEYFHIRTTVVWAESFGVYRQNNFGKCARFLIYCVKDAKNFTFNADTIRVPSDRQLKYNDKRANPKGKVPSNVWADIPRVCGTFKQRIKGLPTQLPEKLLERIVLCSSNEGDLILDPMSGSFTTGAVCLKNNRSFIGIDKSVEYCKVGTKRLEKIC